MSFTHTVAKTDTETRYTLHGPMGSLVLSLATPTGLVRSVGGGRAEPLPPSLTLWIHARHGAHAPSTSYCPVLADAGCIGPCWADILTTHALHTYAPLMSGPDAGVFDALEQEYFRTIEQEARR